jgi:hypothetical protein
MDAAHYAKQALGQVWMGGLGSAYAGSIPPKTLAARLEETTRTIAAQCERIEDALARINGTPRTNHPTQEQEKRATPIRQTAPLLQSVETLEQHAKRMCELSAGLDQVA